MENYTMESINKVCVLASEEYLSQQSYVYDEDTRIGNLH